MNSLENMKQLKELNLCGNRISQIGSQALRENHNLEVLILDLNPIEHIHYSSFGKKLRSD